MNLNVKIASEREEWEQVFRLNYKTFVEEIPQHSTNAEKSLVDKFHTENLYFVCLDGKEVVGMVALRDKRPFSLDVKLPDLERYLPPFARMVEIRLLTIRPDRRHGRIFGLLMKAILDHCRQKQYTLGLISGRLENAPIYRKIGFTAFGPKVGTPGAYYQPMWIDMHTLNKNLSFYSDGNANSAGTDSLEEDAPPMLSRRELNFLPGPVAINSKVRDSLHLPEISHRGKDYRKVLDQVKGRLLEMTGASSLEILLGSGSLANDTIAGQLYLLGQPGLILTNGEFGERLLLHARGLKVKHQVLRLDWGQAFDTAVIEKRLALSPELKWIWTVHCETSTGMLNPIQNLKTICRRRGLLLALDCISSLGIVPVDLRGVNYASGVSGKGLGAFTGLSMVFYQKAIQSDIDTIPRYMDLEYYSRTRGIPFSGSSNLLKALLTSLENRETLAFQERLADDSAWLCRQISDLGIPLLLASEERSPAILTLPLPADHSSQEIGNTLESLGFLVSFNSEYLLAKNWLQICLMAEHSRADLGLLAAALVKTMQQKAIEV